VSVAETAPPERTVVFRRGRLVVNKPRPPRRYLKEITGGQAAFPLLVLFGLNAADELDRTVFGILGPEIRDHFGLTNQGYLTIIALTLLGGLLLEVPLAFSADRLPRARIAVLGAAGWAVFGLATGLASTVLLLVIARAGTGMGRAVVTPTHNSLLSDYYPVKDRARQMGLAAREKVARDYSIAAVARRHLELFGRLLHRQSGGSDQAVG